MSVLDGGIHNIAHTKYCRGFSVEIASISDVYQMRTLCVGVGQGQELSAPPKRNRVASITHVH